MSELTVLAGHARRALAATCGGVLRIDGLAELGCTDGRESAVLDVLLYEDDGEPRFLCEGDSPVARAGHAERAAVLEVSCCRRHGCRRAVRFTGHLAVVATDHVDGLPVHVVGLALGGIEIDEPGRRAAPVPLEHYRADPADADAGADDADEELQAYAERVTRHTNQSHGDALRETAARLAGVGPDQVVAAELADLDVHGVTIQWISIDGARSRLISFPHSANTPGELAVLLRTVLSGA